MWILIYVAFCAIIAIPRQKEARSRDFALHLFRMTSRVLHSAQYHKLYTLDIWTVCNTVNACTTTMTNIRPDRDSNLVPPCRLQAPVDSNEQSGPASHRVSKYKLWSAVQSRNAVIAYLESKHAVTAFWLCTIVYFCSKDGVHCSKTPKLCDKKALYCGKISVILEPRYWSGHYDYHHYCLATTTGSACASITPEAKIANNLCHVIYSLVCKLASDTLARNEEGRLAQWLDRWLTARESTYQCCAVRHIPLTYTLQRGDRL